MVNENESELRNSAIIVALVAVTIVILGAFASALVLASEICLILFLGVLFGVFLTRLSRLLARYTPLAYAWSLAAVTIGLVLGAFGLVTLFGVQVNSQIMEAIDYADEGIKELRDLADRYPTIKSVLHSTPFARQLIDDESAEQSREETEKDEDSTSDEQRESDSAKNSSKAKEMEQNAIRNTAQRGIKAVAGIFRSSFGLLVNGLLIFFTGVFLAIDPAMYRDGCVKLFPKQRRERAREIMDQMGETLWQWLLGRFATMAITGGGAGLLLWALGIPMAFTLGIITALLSFVPNIGPAVALVLAVLFALPQGGTTVLYVVVGYIALQLIESYVITPVIQQKQAALPPALLLSVQALMGVVFGFLGTAVASPLLAVAKVGIEEVYIKDFLESSENS
ncbi:AI-2E family transporter [Bythopirellula goksoeyrii]|uniref:Pheromone autoinducer 2 transporter n=1 Tax=Bythopirellula goksoeyrii TaxID=1400387 RepID=A0A5B9QIS8_9BACT|nr:AI-2E family transporter [Bythopirellula goksoeyrii]QEG36936.1 pheromone autoinducer 2 transporter [Bythopirellula goksoeyrii]